MFNHKNIYIIFAFAVVIVVRTVIAATASVDVAGAVDAVIVFVAQLLFICFYNKIDAHVDR